VSSMRAVPFGLVHIDSYSPTSPTSHFRSHSVTSVKRGRLLLVCFTLAVLDLPWSACAQFTDPRNYENFPVGVNQLELSYAYAHANTSIDPAIIIAGAKLDLNQTSIGYTRYFSFFHRMAWIEPSIPIAVLNGSISNTNVSGSVAGAGDSSYEFATLFKGGAALGVEEFANYKPTTTVGAGLAVTAPTGLYSPDKILNLGADRWSFKPEVAVSYPFGPEQKWAFDGYANSYFYTANTSYRGAEVLRQEPLPGCEGHVSYLFLDRVLVSLDARYSFRGDTSVNGVNQNDSQSNFVLGSELIIDLNARNSLSVTLAKALVHQNGPAVMGISVTYDYVWGKGYRSVAADPRMR
jgi:Putative MetA-pathway of phenol degradation